VLSLDSRKRVTANISISAQFLSAWSPDGNQLGFWQDSSFQTIDPVTGETDQVFRLTEDAYVARVYWFGRDIHPAEPSPSEPPPPSLPTGRILFASNRAKAVDDSYCLSLDIFVQDLDGSSLRNLTPNTYWDGWPTASPNGDRVTFLATSRDTDDDGELSCQDAKELWVMNSDGSDQFRISSESIQVEAPPRWSPDGRQIAFVALEPDLDESKRALYVVNADGSGQQLLADNLEYWPEYKLIGKPFDWLQYSWAPDNRHIAVGGDEITVVSTDEEAENHLTSTCEQPVSDPAWSPDGSQIAFVCAGDEWDEIRVVNSDGTEEHTLLPGLVAAFDSRIANLQWSPDGSQIAFVSEVGLTAAHWRIVEGAGSYFSLHLINSDGSNPRQLARNVAKRFFWTPDGEWLLFSFHRGEVSLVHASGAGLTQLTDDSGDREIVNEQPDWLP
jgi:Tol biopolymer transport system component